MTPFRPPPYALPREFTAAASAEADRFNRLRGRFLQFTERLPSVLADDIRHNNAYAADAKTLSRELLGQPRIESTWTFGGVLWHGPAALTPAGRQKLLAAM
jgi:hypothetical protein